MSDDEPDESPADARTPPGSADAERAATPDPEPGVPEWPPGGHVEWRPWGAEPFEDAAAAEQPVILSLTAAWSEECRRMDAETYGEPRIAAAIGDGFVPVRVDVDRHPRVANRYAMGGVPSTVFLTPDGEVLTGAGPLTVDGLRGAIEGVRRTWSEQGGSAGRIPRSLTDDTPPGGTVDETVEAHLLEVLRENHDQRAGGWGTGAKFPLPRAVEFALKRDREMALRTLDAIDANLLDEQGGGFHRSAANRNWSDLRYAKLLDSNAALVRAFTAAYRYTGEESYREPVERGVEFLTTTLWTDAAPGDGAAFAASQAAGQGADYYALEPTEREGATAPPVDETVLLDWNAVGVDALLAYAAVTDDEGAGAFARRALDTIVRELFEDGTPVHYRDPAGDGERGLLIDYARMIRALVAARSVLGPDPGIGDPPEEADDRDGESPIALARSLADEAIERLESDGSFRDGPASGAGMLDRPLRPLDGNVELAGALLDLATVTEGDRYRDTARAATAAFAGAHERFGPNAAHFGSVAGRLLQGTLRIDVTAPVGSDLHRAALRVADHEAIVVPAAGTGAEEPTESTGDAATGGASKLPEDAAYAVLDGERSEPAFDPEALADSIASVR